MEEKIVFKIKRESIPEPTDFSRMNISCLDFFSSIRKFIDHNFAGAIRVDFPETCSGTVFISPRGFAYFISQLLSEIHGNSLIDVCVNASDTQIFINVYGIESIDRKNRLSDIALRSGFSVLRDENQIILHTPLLFSQPLFLYAKDTLVLINYFYEIFFAGSE